MKIAAAKSFSNAPRATASMANRRRVEKKKYTGSTIAGWTLASHQKFVYNGYKHIATLDAANGNALRQTFLWHGDTLLAVHDLANANTHYYLADANKNIGQLVDPTGSIVAKYEYSPFGQLTAQSGPYAATNPYRFSSEQWDDDLGLVYYNYRYYNPETGRWMSRDPIEESFGITIYVLCKNNSIVNVDTIGLCEVGEISDVNVATMVTPGSVPPNLVDARSEMVTAIGNADTIMKVVNVLTIAVNAGHSIDDAIIETTQMAVEESLDMNGDDISEIANAYGLILEAKAVGYTGYFRLKYKICKCLLGFSYKSDEATEWEAADDKKAKGRVAAYMYQMPIHALAVAIRIGNAKAKGFGK